MVSFDYWNWNWTMILHLVESRYFLINLYDPLLILNKLLIVSSYGQNLIMEVTSEVTSIIYSRYNNNLQIIIMANGLHEKCITDYNYKLRTNVYFNKWSPSKQFNYFINFGSTPSKIQFHLHSLFLFLHCRNLYPYNHRSIRFHCQRFSRYPSSSTNSSKETGLETSYLNPIAYRTHCGRLLVHFQWITFYERSDK